MADFKNSFDLGLKAAEAAAAKLAEIDSVFEEMNRQISEASEGKIAISRESRYSNSINALLGAGIFSNNKKSEKPELTTYIVAKNPLSESSTKADIGEIETNKKGYPCEIRFGSDKFLCEDKVALEKVLSIMLSDPDVGKELARLINLPSKKAV
ncbi:hypothetical protein [Pseudomonas salmasensis]|uniref:hypothetical protein n=1 Tax=Pseudomonas salmasensis TaxID=2745514 RepID=UPI001648417C|nr:hypothetical protein [Pseudomonas salmasensis]QXH77457.1 hypothetical protein HU731_023980 [Pseudomonas salmasensis]